MDATMRKKFAEESSADRKKRQKQMLFPNVFNLALCIAMVIVGAQYKDDCRDGNAPLFLMLGGGIVLATTAFKLIAYFTPCETDDKIAVILEPVADLANFVVLIWGSVVIFGK